MSWFTKFTTPKSPKTLLIGIAEDDNHFCLAYLDANEPIVNFYPKSTALTEILASLPIDLTTKKQIIRPVPYHYIWRKYLIQPLIKDENALFRYVIQTLKQELPISLEEVYFDYLVTPMPEKNLTQIIIYALRKRFAEPLLVDKNTILDCELHCWQRGLHYLLKEKSQNGQIYAFKEKYIEFKLNELSIQTECDQDYLSLNDLKLPEHLISKPLYVLALGAMLWQENKQDSIQ